MIRLHSRVVLTAIVSIALLAATQAQAVPVFVDYDVATTGQSARAGFEFRDASTLQISLFETTPAGDSSLTGGSAILTSLGFLLPRVQIAGGSAVLAPGSTSAGFAGGEILGGASIANLWGYTPTTLPAALQQESAELGIAAASQLQIAAEQDQIAASRRALAFARRNTAAILLGSNPDAQMRGSEEVIVNSILLSLTLSDALLATEQADFPASLLTGSAIGYGKGGFVAGAPRGGPGLPPVAVAEPSMLLLALAALLALARSYAAIVSTLPGIRLTTSVCRSTFLLALSMSIPTRSPPAS